MGPVAATPLAKNILYVQSHRVRRKKFKELYSINGITINVNPKKFSGTITGILAM